VVPLVVPAPFAVAISLAGVAIAVSPIRPAPANTGGRSGPLGHAQYFAYKVNEYYL